MDYTPFGTPIHPDYYGDDQPQDHEDNNEFLRNLHNEYWERLNQKMRESDRLVDEFYNNGEPDEDSDSWENDDLGKSGEGLPLASASDQPPQERSTGKRAQRLFGLAKEVAEAGALLMTEARQAFVYDEAGGYFRSVSNLSAYIAGFFPEEIMSSLLVRDVHEIEEQLSWNSQILCDPDGFNHCPEMVNLENGVLDLKTFELLPHDRKYHFTYQIHANYLKDESDVDCPTFEQFCKTSLEGDPAKRQLLLEFIGYICTDTNDGKCALFLKGQPNSGKSVITKFIRRLFDKDVVTSIPIHQLNDQFFRAELAGKKLNAVGEMAGKALNDISIYKSVTGGDSIEGEFKGKNPFYFTPRCKLLFSGNTLPLPKDLDATAAFVNRIKVLLFNKSVEMKDRDKLLPEKLWDERDSIVTLALQAAQGLVQSGYQFTLPEDSQKFLDGFALRGNILEGFLQECCILRPGARVFNTVLYGALVAYCERHGLECYSRQEFHHLLSGVPNVFYKKVRIGTETRWGHIGIELKAEAIPGTLEQKP